MEMSHHLAYYSNDALNQGRYSNDVLLFQIATTLGDIYHFMSGTFFGVQQKILLKEKSLWEITVESLRYLTEKGLLQKDTVLTEKGLLQKDTVQGSEEEFQYSFRITKLGRASFKGKSFPKSHYKSKEMHWKKYKLFCDFKMNV